MPLFVVMTNLPGPGAAALIDEAATPGLNDINVERAKQAAAGAAEFVELENEHGAGVGPSSGAMWQTEQSFLSDKTYAKLGPFAPCDALAVERGAEAIDDLLQQLGIDPSYAPEHDRTGTVKRILARAVLNAAAKVPS